MEARKMASTTGWNFDEKDLTRKLPDHQKKISQRQLSENKKGCMICGDPNSRQILMNGLPAQLCDDCIQIQHKMYNSTIEEIG
jgi:hypothetical protein